MVVAVGWAAVVLVSIVGASGSVGTIEVNPVNVREASSATPPQSPTGPVNIFHGYFKHQCLSATNDTYGDRRYVYVLQLWGSAKDDPQAKWMIESASDGYYYITNGYPEYLYADSQIEENKNRRRVFTWKGGGSPKNDPQARWMIEHASDGYYYITHGYFKPEYLYASSQTDGDGRHGVFIWQGGGSPKNETTARWRIEPAAINATTASTTTNSPGSGMSVAAWLAVAGSIVVLSCAVLGGVCCCWCLYKSRRGDDRSPQTSDVDHSHDPAWAAVTLDQLNDLRDIAKAEFGVDYATATMHDVNRRILQPMGAQHHKSYAQVVNGSELKHADVFVSHAWSENFEEFVTAVHAPFAHWPVKPHLWICSLALLQSTDPELVALQIGAGDDPSHAPFTKALEQVDKILIVRNQEIDIYGRIWCCWEMFMAYQLNLVQKPGGLLVCGRHADTATQQVDISIAQASSMEDKCKILHYITSQWQSFDSVNRIVAEVRQFVADAAA